LSTEAPDTIADVTEPSLTINVATTPVGDLSLAEEPRRFRAAPIDADRLTPADTVGRPRQSARDKHGRRAAH
jgi:hypothetical protein